MLLLGRLIRIWFCLCFIYCLGCWLSSYSFILLLRFHFYIHAIFICIQGTFKSRLRITDFKKNEIVNKRKYCYYSGSRVLTLSILFCARKKNRNSNNLLTFIFFDIFSLFFWGGYFVNFRTHSQI